MTTATTTASITTDTSDYQLRTMLTSLNSVELNSTSLSVSELTTITLELQDRIKAIRLLTADLELILTISDIQEEIEEILLPSISFRYKKFIMLLGLAVIRSMVEESLLD